MHTRQPRRCTSLFPEPNIPPFRSRRNQTFHRHSIALMRRNQIISQSFGRTKPDTTRSTNQRSITENAKQWDRAILSKTHENVMWSAVTVHTIVPMHEAEGACNLQSPL